MKIIVADATFLTQFTARLAKEQVNVTELLEHIQSSNAVIAGSLPLQVYLREEWAGSDLDIFTTNGQSIQRYLNSAGYRSRVISNRYFTHQKFRNIEEFRLSSDTSFCIQVVECKNKGDIFKMTDLSFCKMSFDGRKLYFADQQEVLSKTGHYDLESPIVVKSLQRIAKYASRGFTIVNQTEILSRTSFTTILEFLANSWNISAPDFKKILFAEIMRHLRQDPEINPNRQISLMQLSLKYGATADLFELLEHPRLELKEIPDLNELSFVDQERFYVKLRKIMIVPEQILRSIHGKYYWERFNYQKFALKDSVHSMYYETVSVADCQCAVCFESLLEPHIKIPSLLPDNFPKILLRMCLPCAIHFANSFISALQDTNPLERKILSYPSMSNALIGLPMSSEIEHYRYEVRPSFIQFMREFVHSGPLVIEYLSKIADPKSAVQFFNSKNLLELQYNKLHTYSLNVFFRTDPKFIACREDNCLGFALVPNDEEFTGVCPVCRVEQAFVGKKIQSEREKEIPVAAQTLQQNNNIRACPTCGILVERNGGCDQMRCPVGHTFDWTKPLPTDSKKVHF